MTFSTAMRATASRLIAQHGVDALYTFVTPGTYDPATGGASLSTFNFPIKAVVSSAGRELKDGAWIEREGHRLTVAASNLPAPCRPNDRLAWDGATYLVTQARPVYAGDAVASFELLVVKA